MPRPCTACNEVTEASPRPTDEELVQEGRRLLDAAIERGKPIGSIEWKRWNVFILERGHRLLELAERQFKAPSDSIHFEDQELEDLRNALGFFMDQHSCNEGTVETCADMEKLDARILVELRRRHA